MSRERTLKKPKYLAITRSLSDLDRLAYPSRAAPKSALLDSRYDVDTH
jgi:hypothetical protein